MSNDDILFTKEDGVGIITLNRPDKMNAITTEMGYYKLPGLLGEINSDDEVKAVIFTGAGKGFCSGADVSTRLADNIGGVVAETRYENLMHTGTVAMSFETLDKPIIAAVNGVAVGAGLSLALASDIRIASEKARFGAVWVKRGLIPDAGATWFMPRVLAFDKAIELAFTGDLIGAEEALAIGLVTRIVPHDELMPKARELAQKIATGPSVAIELIKRGFRRSLTNDLKQQLDFETYAQNLCRQTEDHKEGVKSFMEKRAPNFKGR